MAISVHPYISGVPHRISYLEKLIEYIRSREQTVIWTGEEILDWFLKQNPKKAKSKKRRRKK
jgi:hypothetical protein